MHSAEHDESCLLYLAGELPSAEGERFRAHREGCADCAALTRALETGTQAAALAAVSVSEGARDRIVERVLDEAPPEDSLRPFWGGRILVAAAAMLAIGTYFAMAPTNSYDELAWISGVESGIERLDAQLESLDRSLALDDTSVEIDSELERLRRESEWIEGRIQGG
ncbi:MAG: hypothetical protein ABIJ96_12695 [Elusimicrobiota bacterium]